MTLRIVAASSVDLTDADRARAHALFEVAYGGANHEYLDASIQRLGHVALAFVESDGGADGWLVGFAIGGARVLDLPRLGPSPVALAGVACVADEARRQGLFRRMEMAAVGAAFTAAGVPPAERVLACGRMAHPVSFRSMRTQAGVVPVAGLVPSAWHQEVAQAVVKAYGAPGFDPVTFVCKGSGAPVGEPRLDYEVEPEEWEVFRPVDRSRGDTLLGMCWTPDAPPGW